MNNQCGSCLYNSFPDLCACDAGNIDPETDEEILCVGYEEFTISKYNILKDEMREIYGQLGDFFW